MAESFTCSLLLVASLTVALLAGCGNMAKTVTEKEGVSADTTVEGQGTTGEQTTILWIPTVQKKH
jgi:uncharacterized protein YceK